MESLNKIISFILGLVVVIVFTSIITGKIAMNRPAVSKTPCKDYQDTTLNFLPARCLNYYLKDVGR